MPTKSNYVCVACGLAMTPAENGVIGVELFTRAGKPYKLWSCDLWECELCKHQILAGFPAKEFKGHWEERFDSMLELCEANDTVVYFY